MNPAQSILKDLIGELKNLARTETIVGSPITAGEFTLIPICRVSLGVGAGGGSGEGERKVSTGEGGGGGGGIRVNPIALVTVRGADIHIHTLGRGSSIGHTVERIPDLLERSLERILDNLKIRQGKSEREGS